MSDGPIVSVIIPTFNRSDQVLRAVRSALSQSLTNLEVIVVDDGSTDETHEVLAAVDDERLRLVVHGENRGGSAARNTGADAARGRYLALLDSDDEWDARKLQTYVEAMESTGGRAEAAVGAIRRSVARGPEVLVVPQRQDFEPARLLSRSIANAGSTLVVTKAAWNAVGGFDERLPRHQDWDFVLRLADRVEFALVDEPLVTVHVETFPDIATVRDAKARFLSVHADRLDRLPSLQRRLVRAHHHLDVVALGLRFGAWREVIRAGVAALLTHPGIARRLASLVIGITRNEVRRRRR